MQKLRGQAETARSAPSLFPPPTLSLSVEAILVSAQSRVLDLLSAALHLSTGSSNELNR